MNHVTKYGMFGTYTKHGTNNLTRNRNESFSSSISSRTTVVSYSYTVIVSTALGAVEDDIS
jgi:hypothetical protein